MKSKKKHKPQQVTTAYLRAINGNLLRIAAALEKIARQGSSPDIYVGDNCAVAIGTASASIGEAKSCHIRQDHNDNSVLYGRVNTSGSFANELQRVGNIIADSVAGVNEKATTINHAH